MKGNGGKCDNLEINRKAFFAHLSDFTLVSTRSGRQEDLTGGHCGAAWRGEGSLWGISTYCPVWETSVSSLLVRGGDVDVALAHNSLMTALRGNSNSVVTAWWQQTASLATARWHLAMWRFNDGFCENTPPGNFETMSEEGLKYSGDWINGREWTVGGYADWILLLFTTICWFFSSWHVFLRGGQKWRWCRRKVIHFIVWSQPLVQIFQSSSLVIKSVCVIFQSSMACQESSKRVCIGRFLGFSTLRMRRWSCPCPARTETPRRKSCLGGEERIGPSSLDPQHWGLSWGCGWYWWWRWWW